MRMGNGQPDKISQYERSFVCQYEMARDCKPPIQLIQHIPHGGHNEGKLSIFYQEGVSSHLVLATGRKVTFHDLKQCKICMITLKLSFCISPSTESTNFN